MMVLGLALQTEVIEGKEAGLPHHFSGNTPKHTSPRDKATSFQFLHFTWNFINNIFKYTLKNIIVIIITNFKSFYLPFLKLSSFYGTVPSRDGRMNCQCRKVPWRAIQALRRTCANENHT